MNGNRPDAEETRDFLPPAKALLLVPVGRPDEKLVTATQVGFPVGLAFNAASRVDTGNVAAALRSNDDAAIHEAATLLRESIPDDDPAKGWVLKETGKRLVEAGGKAAPALPDFLKVAKGEVAATLEDRREAQLLAADSVHYFYFKPIRGHHAYQEIIDQWGSDPAVKARCMVEIAACLLELARSEAATFDEVRRYCVKVRREVAPEFARAHAVADLIYCESLMYAGREEAALLITSTSCGFRPTACRSIRSPHRAPG